LSPGELHEGAYSLTLLVAGIGDLSRHTDAVFWTDRRPDGDAVRRASASRSVTWWNSNMTWLSTRGVAATRARGG
jgi:hypothetical protein